MSPVAYGLVLFSALLHAGWNAVLRGGDDRTWAAGWMGIATFAVAAPLLPFVPIPAAAAWPSIAFSSGLHVIYMELLMIAYRKGELSTAYPIARGTSPVLVTLGAWLLVREVPSPFAIAGVFIVSAGILSIALERGHFDRLNIDRGTLIASLLTGVTIACYTVSDGIGVRTAGNALSYNVWIFSIYGLLMTLVFIARRGTKALKGEPRRVGLAVGGGIVSVVAYALVTMAMQHGAMGQVSALRETSVVFAALIGRFFLGESLQARRLAACFAVAAGAVLLAH